MATENVQHTTKGELAKALIEFQKSGGQGDFSKLLKLIEDQSDFIGSLASQSTRATYRQLLKLGEDFVVSHDAIKRAEENKVITEEFAKVLRENYESLEDSFLGFKAETLGYLMAAAGNGSGYVNHLQKSLADYNTYTQNLAETTRQYKNSFGFDIKLNSHLPAHRLNDTILESFEFDFYAVPGVTVEEVSTDADGNEVKVEKTVNFIPCQEAGDYNLDVKKTLNYDEKKKTLNCRFEVIDKNTGITRTKVALLVNPENTLRNFINDFATQYLITSSIIIDDFAGEAVMIDTLYLKPLAAFLEQTLDQNLVIDARNINAIFADVKKAVAEARASITENNKKNPFLEGYLAIVEDGITSTQNKGEVISRISKTDVIKKLYQGSAEKYERAISAKFPIQVVLDKRFSIFRAELEDEVIDFIIFSYGINKTRIWLPIDKTFAAKKAAVNTWETFGLSTQDVKRRSEQDGETETTYVSIPSTQINPDIK